MELGKLTDALSVRISAGRSRFTHGAMDSMVQALEEEIFGFLLVAPVVRTEQGNVHLSTVAPDFANEC